MTERITLLQAWLALEHEAVWLYGVIGGRVSAMDDAATTSWNQHRTTRDRLIAAVRSAGGVPVGPSMGYASTAVNSTSEARQAAQSIENRLANACLGALASDTDRIQAIRGLEASARSVVLWGGAPEAFPGLA